MEYRPCGDPCLPSCADPRGQNCGDLGPCTEGCFCKSGYVFDGKKCIPKSSCGCMIDSLGIFINVSLEIYLLKCFYFIKYIIEC